MKSYPFSICIALGLVVTANAQRIVNYDMDVQKVYSVKTSLGVITTIVFPDQIEAIESIGFAFPGEKEDVGAKFILAFRQKTNHFAVSPRVKEGITNCNVRVGGEMYSLQFIATGNENNATFKVIFDDEFDGAMVNFADNKVKPLDLSARKPIDPATAVSLIDRVILHPLDRKGEYDNFLISSPSKKYTLNGVNMTLKKVYREHSMDALCFVMDFESTDGQRHYYDAENFRVQVGNREYRQFTCKASGVIEPGVRSEGYFVIIGDGTQNGRNDLAVTNDWEVKLRLISGQKRSEPLLPSPFQAPKTIRDYKPSFQNLNSTPPVIRHDKK